jgi:hypothetical protein
LTEITKVPFFREEESLLSFSSFFFYLFLLSSLQQFLHSKMNDFGHHLGSILTNEILYMVFSEEEFLLLLLFQQFLHSGMNDQQHNHGQYNRLFQCFQTRHARNLLVIYGKIN